MPEFAHKISSEAEAIGHLMSLTRLSPIHRSIASGSLIDTYSTAFQLEQMHVLFDHDKKPCGFILWAWISEKTYSEVTRSGVYEMHPSEWNEGTNLAILDVLIAQEYQLDYWDFVMNIRFPHCQTISYFEKFSDPTSRLRRVSMRSLNKYIRKNI